MLVRFSLENYRCFKDRITLDMVASPDKLHPQNLYSSEDGKTRILKTCSLYGSNASGKTTVIGAIYSMKDFVMGSNRNNTNQPLNYTPFAFDDEGRSRPTRLEAEFINDGIRYVYGYSFYSDRVSEEHLYSFPRGRRKVIFIRDETGYQFKSDVKLRTDISRRMDPKKLYVSFAAQFNDPECKAVVDWFSNKLLAMINYNVDQSLEILFDTMQRDPIFRSYIMKALRIADFGITDLQDESRLVNVAPTAMTMRIHDYRAQHTIEGKKVSLPLLAESSGTIRFLAVIGPVVDALMRGTTLCVDEMDMSFHTDLCRWIVGLFQDPEQNGNNAQLIFNTHDPELLDQSLIRRDQVWIVSRSFKTSQSSMVNLSSYRVRNDLDIRKAYINGSLGGVPFIESEILIE